MEKITTIGFEVAKYDDIVDHCCCDAWLKLENQPWRIMSVGPREWVNGF